MVFPIINFHLKSKILKGNRFVSRYSGKGTVLFVDVKVRKRFNFIPYIKHYHIMASPNSGNKGDL